MWAELGLGSRFWGSFWRVVGVGSDQFSYGPDGVGVVDAAEFVLFAGFAGALVISADFPGESDEFGFCLGLGFGFVLRNGAGGWDCL